MHTPFSISVVKFLVNKLIIILFLFTTYKGFLTCNFKSKYTFSSRLVSHLNLDTELYVSILSNLHFYNLTTFKNK